MAKMSTEMKALTQMLRLLDKLETGVAERLLNYCQQKIQERRIEDLQKRPAIQGAVPVPTNGYTGRYE